MAVKKQGQHVLITTEFRGVFFGEIVDDKKAPEKIVLKNARNCISWHSSVNGVFGLAATGPNSQCKIGPTIPHFTAWKITSVTHCTDDAVTAWQAA